MDCTNCGEECCWVKSGFCKTDKECPFHVATWWQLEGEAHPRMITDCFPKRFALEQNGILHRLICVESVMEEVRNRMDRLETSLNYLITQSHEFLKERKSEQIEQNKTNLFLTNEGNKQS